MIKKIGDTINEQMDFLLKEIEAVPDTKDRATLRLNLIKMLLTAFPSGVTVSNSAETVKEELVTPKKEESKPEEKYLVSKREDFKKEEKIIEEEEDPNAWTDEARRMFKDKLEYVESIKARLGEDADKVIDDLVKEFSSNNLTSYDEIGPLNIVAFATYLKSNVETVDDTNAEKSEAISPGETSEAVTTWTEETLEEFKDEIAYIQEIKNTLGDDANQLNTIVSEYSNGKITSIDDLTPIDIKGFVDYLKALSEE